MIGVFCQDNERNVFTEFFELFKTPWEFFEPDHSYDVVLSTQPTLADHGEARLVIVYSAKRTAYDELFNLTLQGSLSPRLIMSSENLLPVYGRGAIISGKGNLLLWEQSTNAPVAIEISESSQTVVRIGFNLGEEIAFLLLEGQPVEFAQYPSLDIHISLLRSWILNAGMALVEIPPQPMGYKSFACITHDVDFSGIRNHKFDATMWGFLYRAVFGSLVDLFKGKIRVNALLTNWLAVLKLPLVYLGLVKDFWKDFDDYVVADRGFTSTFFLIPIKNYAGLQKDDQKQGKRAVPYQINEVSDQVKYLLESGYEIGLHGIDAWQNSDSGRNELRLVADVTHQKRVGIRMHWLFFDHDTPRILEQAGFEYDATLGYNDTVGYRNGTAQVFCPIGLSELVELPLHIQDTALFFPRRLNLASEAARQLCQPILDFVFDSGGVLTISWHERSLKPERLWGDFYRWLLDELQSGNAWIGNAQQITDWFRLRRSFKFRRKDNHAVAVLIDAPTVESDLGPGIFIRLHAPFKPVLSPAEARDNFRDIPWNGRKMIDLSLGGEIE